MRAGNRIVINTGILYGRMLLTVGIALYSTRLILNALGVVDYGIFNLISGVIAMLSFLNTAMSTSTQRYLSFYQGKKDLDMQRVVFGNSLLLHIIIGLVIVVGLELTGFFIFKGFLNIPAARLEAAKVIYHFMSATVFFTIVTVPFTASLSAHENMLWIAVVNVIETVLKLLVAIYLSYAHFDKLITYGILTECITMISLILYATFCFTRYKECTVKKIFNVDKVLIKELTSFVGWNLFGSLCGLGRSQGLAVMLNTFFGTVVNAAYGIANQISAQLNFFSVTLLRVLNPQIMMSEGANDRKRMLRLSMIASKFGFFLLAFIALPCIFEMPTILQLWLKTVPDYTVVFCRLILVGTLINQLTIGLQSAAQATGKIKVYQAVVGTTLLLNLPIAFCLLKFGLSAYYVLVSYCCVEATGCSLRLYFLKKLAGLSIKEYFSRVIFKEILPVSLAAIVGFLMTQLVHLHFRFLLTISISTLIFTLSIYFTGLCEDEKLVIDRLFAKIKFKVLKVKVQ